MLDRDTNKYTNYVTNKEITKSTKSIDKYKDQLIEKHENKLMDNFKT